MSYNQTGQGICEAALVSLASIAMQNAPELNVQTIGALRVLNSPEMNVGIDVIQGAQGDKGHVRDVRIKYLRRSLESETLDSPACDYNSDEGYLEDQATVDLYKSINFTIDLNYIRQLCEDASQAMNEFRATGIMPPPTPVMSYVAKKIATQFNGLLAAINRDALTFIQASYGINAVTGTSAQRSATMLYAATGQPNALGIQRILQDYTAYNQQNYKPIALGTGILDRFAKASQYFCCSTGGVDFGALAASNPLMYFPEDPSQVADVLGSVNAFALLAPGSMVMFDAMRNKGNFAGQHGLTYYTTFAPDTMPNMEFDISVLSDFCGDATREVKISISKSYGFWGIPTDAYQSGDPLNGVTGAFDYIATEA
jgi:hypothetical protein